MPYLIGLFLVPYILFVYCIIRRVCKASDQWCKETDAILNKKLDKFSEPSHMSDIEIVMKGLEDAQQTGSTHDCNP